ncbi:HNH endonuclease [Sphingomonas paucimobilis]|uniref:HNH endonuclease n=1 Tax=Sphingomonas TaxID=13687 RepID=UPI00338DA420
MQVHHRNEDKLDNRLKNLELLSPLVHKREHSGCELRDGEWWKPCRQCGELRHISDYYKRIDGISSRCKPCTIRNAVQNKRNRRAV